MPHCYICDKELTEVLLDGRDLKPRPCTECEEAIDEAVAWFREEGELLSPDYIFCIESEELDEEVGSTDRKDRLDYTER